MPSQRSAFTQQSESLKQSDIRVGNFVENLHNSCFDTVYDKSLDNWVAPEGTLGVIQDHLSTFRELNDNEQDRADSLVKEIGLCETGVLDLLANRRSLICEAVSTSLKHESKRSLSKYTCTLPKQASFRDVRGSRNKGPGSFRAKSHGDRGDGSSWQDNEGKETRQKDISMGPYQSQQEMDFGGRYSSGSQKMQIGRESGKWGDQNPADSDGEQGRQDAADAISEANIRSEENYLRTSGQDKQGLKNQYAEQGSNNHLIYSRHEAPWQTDWYQRRSVGRSSGLNKYAGEADRVEELIREECSSGQEDREELLPWAGRLTGNPYQELPPDDLDDLRGSRQKYRGEIQRELRKRDSSESFNSQDGFVVIAKDNADRVPEWDALNRWHKVSAGDNLQNPAGSGKVTEDGFLVLG